MDGLVREQLTHNYYELLICFLKGVRVSKERYGTLTLKNLEIDC
jgi:hypothetical protein